MTNNTPTLTFSQTAVDGFNIYCNTAEGRAKLEHLRLGQLFHQFFHLEKMTSPENKAWADKLYQMDGQQARAFVAERTDYTQ